MFSEVSFLFLILAIAILYSIIGHGGASGYIAIMVIWAVPFMYIKPTALLLNIAVSALAFVMYFQAGHFKLKLFWPLVLTSIPAAFLGGLINVNQSVIHIILAIILLFSVYQLLVRKKLDVDNNGVVPFTYLLVIGALIGFLSGLLGIGGGILLSPLLILFRWANARTAAAISAPFILVNSLSGFSAFAFTGGAIPDGIAPLIAVVILGGFIGSSVGSRNISLYGLRIVLSATLVFAAFKLISL